MRAIKIDRRTKNKKEEKKTKNNSSNNYNKSTTTSHCSTRFTRSKIPAAVIIIDGWFLRRLLDPDPVPNHHRHGVTAL